MAHGITEQDRVNVTQQPAWHGLETYLGDEAVDGATIMDGLDWRVGLRDAYYLHNGVFVKSQFEKLIVREDIGIDFGPCKKGYETYQNIEATHWLIDLFGGDVRFATAGTLYQGKRVWVLAETPNHFVIHQKDGSVVEHKLYFNISIGHDGKTKVIGTATDWRVVCANTLALAEESGTTSFAFAHTRSLRDRLEEARGVITNSIEVHKELQPVLQELAEVPMTRAEFVHYAITLIASDTHPRILAEDCDRVERIERVREFVAKLPEHGVDPKGKEVRDRSRSIFDNKVEALVAYFDTGNQGAGDTLNGALQSITAYVDHKKSVGKTAADKIRLASRNTDSAWYGSGQDTKQRALRLARNW